MATSSTQPAAPWNFKVLGVAVLVGLGLQFQNLLPANLNTVYGHFSQLAQFQIALAFDGIVIARMLVAAILRERDRNWILYLVLSVTSAWWIHLLYLLVRPPYAA